jgi:putative transposase
VEDDSSRILLGQHYPSVFSAVGKSGGIQGSVEEKPEQVRRAEGTRLEMANIGQPDDLFASKRGEKTGKNPTDRGKLGTKRHIVVDRNGIPLSAVLSGANDHDSRSPHAAWSSIILRRPDPCSVVQHAVEDKAYDSEELRKWLGARGYRVHIPYRGVDAGTVPKGKRYPAKRWVVERTGRWHNLFRRLKIRYEVKAANYLGFVQFANAIICYRSC